MDISSLLSTGMENPGQGALMLVVALFGVFSLIKSLPFIIGLALGFVGRGVTGMVTNTVKTAKRVAAGRARTLPRTRGEVQAYEPRKGDEWHWPEKNVYKTVLSTYKQNGQKYVRCMVDNDPSRYTDTELTAFRGQVRLARPLNG